MCRITPNYSVQYQTTQVTFHYYPVARAAHSPEMVEEYRVDIARANVAD